MTKADILEYLQISRATLAKLMKSRQIPYIKLNRRVLFRKQDVDKFLESRLVK